jgi:hypothetical protein
MVVIQGDPRFESADIHGRFEQHAAERCLIAVAPVDAAEYRAQL